MRSLLRQTPEVHELSDFPSEPDDVVVALFAIAWRRDLREQVIGYALLTLAQVIEIRMNVTSVRVAVPGALRLVVGQRALVAIGESEFLIGCGDPAMPQGVR